MQSARCYDALISATDGQLAAVTAIVGPDNIHRVVMGDNGVPTFYHEGPEILEQIASVLSDPERARLKSWDELDEDTRHSVLSHAAGCQDLDNRYLAYLLADLPEFKAALLNPAGHQLS